MIRRNKVALFVSAWIETWSEITNKPTVMSHSSWVRGLKPFIFIRKEYKPVCRTLRECVDWNCIYDDCSYEEYRRTLRECVDWNMCFNSSSITLLSHSSWVRGLKLRRHHTLDCRRHSRTLRECVDWNSNGRNTFDTVIESHSSWVRGLKLRKYVPFLFYSCRTLRECVDWNYPASTGKTGEQVALFVSAWIETLFNGE